MQSSDSQTSSSSLSDSHKNEIGLFLVKKFFKGIDCDRPSKLRDNRFHGVQDALDLAKDTVEQGTPDRRKKGLANSSRALVRALNPQHDESKVEKCLDELSTKVEEVIRGQSETLRPFLDILINRRIYTDPDAIEISRHAMDLADSKAAWAKAYQGQAHVTLLANIQRSFQPLPYANSGSIIQSSGYGKSRTVDEMAKLIPTIPMNIRAVVEAEEGAFPPTDARLIDLFDDMGNFPNPVNRLYLFFTELFGLVRNLAQGFERENFATSLYGHFNDLGRAKFYADLLKIMNKDRSEGLAKEHALASFKELAKLLPKSKEKVKMVIYIDEAHELAKNIRRPSIYDDVLKVSAELAFDGVFFLFLSTASRLEVLAGQASLSRSSRYRVAGDYLVPPFTEMPFDCHKKLVEGIQPGLMLEEIQKFSFAVQFGRPLFWAYYEVMLSNGEDSAHNATVGLAMAKLISSQTATVSSDSPGNLAILDTLLNLEYDPRRTHSDHLASTMVASHMRTVYSVPPSRAYMHTGYPSEPVLAEAALAYLNSPAVGRLFSIYKTVDTNTAAGAIDKGERGENVGKMILLLAYIAAVKKSSEEGTHPQFWGEGCSLVDFMTELTGKDYRLVVLGSTPENIEGGLPLEERFEKSWVRFTHFARASDDSAMTSSAAFGAFIRGMALIGWHSQTAVDVNIPILLDKDKPITESNISSTLIQLKVCSVPTAEDKAAVGAETIKYFPPPESSRDVFANPDAPSDEKKEYHTRPYISLVMELGLVATSAGGRIRRKVVDLLDSKSPASKDTPKPTAPVLNVHRGSGVSPVADRTRSKGDASSPHIHPRYSLFYYGCSHDIYQCIQPTEEETCKALLQISTVFNDRSWNRPVDPVLQMKPFWGVGKNSWSWLKNGYLNQDGWERQLHDDQVLVGGAMGTNQDPNAMDESH